MSDCSTLNENKTFSFKDYLFRIEEKYHDICLENDELKKEKERLETINKILKDSNEKLQSGIFEFEYIKKCHEEIKELNNMLRQGHLFELSGYEKQKIAEWRRKHDEEVHGADYDNHKFRYNGAIGGEYTYCFTPTSIGTVGIVKCCCGEEYVFRRM